MALDLKPPYTREDQDRWEAKALDLGDELRKRILKITAFPTTTLNVGEKDYSHKLGVLMDYVRNREEAEGGLEQGPNDEEAETDEKNDAQLLTELIPDKISPPIPMKRKRAEIKQMKKERLHEKRLRRKANQKAKKLHLEASESSGSDNSEITTESSDD
jgi:hypothetical protein